VTPAELERTVILPWSMVMHDNHRLMPLRMGKGVRLITSPQYRAAKLQAEYEIKRQWRIPALSGDVVLSAKVFFPNKRKRDAGNYRKLVTDAMTGICYGDDSQLSSETWCRVGISKDNPRIEITLEEKAA
jgi:Holliday junction resolvase RusA-like endonuclease